jgi:hypothetical protein
MSVEVEHFAYPGSVRAAGALERRRRGAEAALAGRTVWCASADANVAGTARRIRSCVERLGQGTIIAICVEYTESAVHPERAGDALVALEPGRGDVVVLFDPRSAALTPVVRDYGAHAVWAFRSPSAERSELPVARYRSAVDAYLDDALAPLGRGRVGERVTVRVPAVRLAVSKVIEPDTSPMGPDLGFGSALADVVGHDRGECVGGILHARPTVAGR